MTDLMKLTLKKSIFPINSSSLTINKLISFLDKYQVAYRLTQIYGTTGSREQENKIPLLFHNKIITFSSAEKLIEKEFGEPDFYSKINQYDTKKTIYSTRYPRKILDDFVLEKEIFSPRIRGNEIIGKTSIIYGKDAAILNLYITQKNLKVSHFDKRKDFF